MTGSSKRSKIQQERDRVVISELYLRGWSQAKIGEHLGLNQSQISRELSKIESIWKQESTRDYDLCIEQELLRLSLLEAELWAAWEQSRLPKESTSSQKRESKIAVAKRTESQAGNPQFLQGVQSCIDRRCKLLGLDAPTKSEHTGAYGSPMYVVALPQQAPTVESWLQTLN
jgi:hypothetical protein